jgi:hypothetical protein
MSLTIDDETVRLVEKLAALLRVDKIEAMCVALVNALRIYEASLGSEAEPRPAAESSKSEPDIEPGSR